MQRFFKHPWIIIAVVLIITGVLGFQLKNLTLENSIRSFFPQNDKAYTRLIDTEETFGSMVVIGMSLETMDNSIVTPENIEIVRKLSDDLEALPGVEGVDSLTNIDYIFGKDGGLVSDSIVTDDYTGSDEDIAEIKQKLVDWDDMYDRVIMSDNGKATQLQITLDKNSSANEREATLNEIRKIAAKDIPEEAELKVTLYGDPVFSQETKKFMISDLAKLIPLVAIVVLISLFFSFKTVDGTILPLLTVLISATWSCGIMALRGEIFTLVSSVIPVALIACGSAYGIHVLTHYYIALDEIEGEITKEKHKEAILFALKDVWVAVFLSGLTTFIGFLSNVTSPIIPLKGFSLYTALGIVFALVLSVTFIPAMLMVKRLDKIGHKSRIMAKLEARVKAKLEIARAHRHGETSKEGTSTYYVIYRFFTGTAPRLVLSCLAIIIFSIIGIKKIVVDTAMINYLPPDSDYRVDTDSIDERFAGTNQIFLLVKGQENGDMTKPSILKPIDDMQKELELHHPEIGKIVSFTTFLKRMNQVMHVPVVNPSSESVEDDYVADDSSDEGFSSFFDDGESSADASSDEGFSSFFDNEESSESSSEGFSSFFDEGESTNSSNETAVNGDFVDPNVKYAEELSKPMTYADGIALLNSAYAEAGGSHAKVRDIVRILQKKMNYNGLDYYEVPSDVRKYPVADEEGLANLVSQYLILLGNDDMNKFLQSDMIQPKDMRITVMLRTHNTVGTKAVIADAEDYAKKHFPEGYTLEATGNAQMEAAMADMVVSSQLVSLLLSLISVFLILAISFKSPFAGLIGCLPLAFSILLNYMVMGFANINLDLFTSIIASVAVGVGIDYTIHFMESYKSERQKSDDLRAVTIGTFRKSGSGIVTNAIAVGLGFLVLCLSYFVILRYIGLLIAVVMFTSSAMAMTIIPGILNLVDPKFMRGKNKPQSMPAGAATASTIDVDSNKEKIEKLEKGNK